MSVPHGQPVYDTHSYQSLPTSLGTQRPMSSNRGQGRAQVRLQVLLEEQLRQGTSATQVQGGWADSEWGVNPRVPVGLLNGSSQSRI